MKQLNAFLFFLFSILLSSNIFALQTDHAMTVTLQTDDGKESVDIGQITFTAKEEGYSYQFVLNEDNFEKQFLSMRPFDCMQKPEIMICHLPYPYKNNRTISTEDIADLEYDLLFLHKSPGAYGIDAYNGIYYKLQITDKGITGALHDIDLNVLKIPPEEGNLRPVTLDMLYEPTSSKHWFEKVLIH